MAPRPDATVTLAFERPHEDVRALFFDVDLAVRDKIHRGVRLQWLPRTPDGQRRLRRHVRVMDRIVADDIVIEPGEGGAWVQRFVEGPSAGTRFEGTFEPDGEAVTHVRLEAYVGPRGFAQGLGKLSPLGLEKALKRLLLEYQRALEKYEPGRARGAVVAAVEQMTPWSGPTRSLDDPQRRRVVATLLETAWSIACVDDSPDEAERDVLRAAVAGLWHTTLDRAAEERMVKAAADAVAAQGVEARCQALGTKLAGMGFGLLGVRLAVLVAEVSHGLSPEELAALRALAQAAGVDDDQLNLVLRQTDAALSGGNPLADMSMLV